MLSDAKRIPFCTAVDLAKGGAERWREERSKESFSFTSNVMAFHFSGQQQLFLRREKEARAREGGEKWPRLMGQKRHNECKAACSLAS